MANPWRTVVEDEAQDERRGTSDGPLLSLLTESPAGGYLCADFSIADVSMMVLAMVLEVDGMPSDKFPRVARYLDFLRTRPSYRSISPQTKVAEATASKPTV